MGKEDEVKKGKISEKPAWETYIKEALAGGAVDAKLISTDTVVTAQWVRLKCQFGCGGFGKSLTCPPHSPTPEKTAQALREYRTAILVHSDGEASITQLLVHLERRAFLDGYYKAFALVAGPCELCKSCHPEKGDCRHPHKARPAMEACGIDVYQTARNNGMPIEVVIRSASPQNYYGLLLLE
jgi:predicted metal-binding protein